MDAPRLFRIILIAAILAVMGTSAAFLAADADLYHVPGERGPALTAMYKSV